MDRPGPVKDKPLALVLPELDPAIGAFSAEQFPQVIAEGARAARQQLPYLHRLLS